MTGDGKGWRDEEGRRKWQNPEKLLRGFGLKEGDTFIDVGCGQGFFLLPAIEVTGSSGTVIGVDASEENIGFLRGRLSAEGLKASLTVSKAEEWIACDACADMIFFGTVLHDFNDPLKVLQNSAQMLKPAGRLINLDWKKEPTEMGPPLDIRFTIEKASTLIRDAGLVVTGIGESGKMQYFIEARLSVKS